MKTVLLALALLLFQADTPTDTGIGPQKEVDAAPQRFALQRTLVLPAGGVNGQACAVLDAPVYSHTEAQLNNVRLYRLVNGTPAAEVPFALTESGQATQQPEPARILNLGQANNSISFDLAMPQRTYTSVDLALDAHDFIASAHVFGASAQQAPRTDLGTFALFDLSAQGLSRSTTLPLQEVSFPILHIELTLHPAPGAPPDAPTLTPQIVTGAEVPPSREAQTLYTTVAQTSTFTIKGRESFASILAPAHVPVERALFTLAPGFAKNFSRGVRLAAYPGTQRAVAKGPRDYVPSDETLSGTIQRVAFPASGFYPAIQEEQLTLESVLSSNLRTDATVELHIENGDDPPLPLASIALQMRRRMLCFDADPGTAYALLYGAAGVTQPPVRTPVYEYARLFRPSDHPSVPTLGPETPNPLFSPLPIEVTLTPYTERHPEFLWIVLIAVVAVLGTIAIRSAKRLS